MVFRFLKSKKLFLALVMLFLMVSICDVILLNGRTIGQIGMLKANLPTCMKTMFTITTLMIFLIGVQTIICGLDKSIKGLIHIILGLTLIFLCSPIFMVKKQFYMYPRTYVKIDDRLIVLKKFSFDYKNLNYRADFIIENGKRNAEGSVSYNKPMLSRLGNIWIKGISSRNGLPMVYVEYMKFSLVPYIILALGLASTLGLLYLTCFP